MRKNDYIIDQNDFFLINPVNTDDEDEEEDEIYHDAVDEVDKLGTGADYEEEDWD